MKKKRLRTFFEGVGTVLQIYPSQSRPTRRRFYREPASSVEAIASDWIQVGKSLRSAMNDCAEHYAPRAE